MNCNVNIPVKGVTTNRLRTTFWEVDSGGKLRVRTERSRFFPPHFCLFASCFRR